MATVRLEAVDKRYPNGFVAARAISLEVADGELVVLVGPSGCGKSTTLRMIAGLETPSGGRILIGKRDVTKLPPQERDIAMVFQSYALYPHKTVRDNLAFALKMRKVARSEIDKRIQAAADSLGLVPMLDRKPAQLSGGQRQRVALGRAIVREPSVFLFDEPLSNLDAKLRAQTRAELARLHRRLGATMVYVTHDQEEAMTLGDRIAVLRDGCLLQIAPPMEVYRRPATAFVAGFVGSPAMNLVPCRVRPDGDETEVEGPLGKLRLGKLAKQAGQDGKAVLGVRPHDVTIGATEGADCVARADVVEPLGAALLVHLKAGEGSELVDLRVAAPPETEIKEGDTVGLTLRRDRTHLFDADSEQRLGPS